MRWITALSVISLCRKRCQIDFSAVDTYKYVKVHTADIVKDRQKNYLKICITYLGICGNM